MFFSTPLRPPPLPRTRWRSFARSTLLPDFIPAASNRWTAHARDYRQQFYSTATPLRGQNTDKPASALLIQACQNPIDRGMFFRCFTIRMLATAWAHARANGSVWPVFHELQSRTFLLA